MGKKKDHNAQVQDLLKKATIEQSSPTPWELYWDEGSGPLIVDAEGRIIAVLSTGKLSGAWSTEEILANAKRLLSGSE